MLTRVVALLVAGLGCDSRGRTGSGQDPELGYGGDPCESDAQCANQMRCIGGTCQLCPDGEEAIFSGGAFTCGPPCTVASSECAVGEVCAAFANFPERGVCVDESWGESVQPSPQGPADGNCSSQCDLQCDRGLPEQACYYCQAACLCRCSGQQDCYDSSCAMVNSLNASGGDNWCPTICP